MSAFFVFCGSALPFTARNTSAASTFSPSANAFSCICPATARKIRPGTSSRLFSMLSKTFSRSLSRKTVMLCVKNPAMVSDWCISRALPRGVNMLNKAVIFSGSAVTDAASRRYSSDSILHLLPYSSAFDMCFIYIASKNSSIEKSFAMPVKKLNASYSGSGSCVIIFTSVCNFRFNNITTFAKKLLTRTPF